MKKRILFVVMPILGLVPMPAHAKRQLIEPIFAYLVNRELSRSERKEYPNSQILMNIRIINPQGVARMLPGWDTSLPTSVAFDAPPKWEVEFEPTIMSTASSSPHVISLYLDNRLVDVRHFHGGKREGLKITDNRGMVDDTSSKDNDKRVVRNFSVSLTSLEYGWHTIKLVADNTTAVCKFQRTDYVSLASLIADEGAQHAMIGYGQSSYPSAPVLATLVGDKLVTAMSQQELDTKIAGINARLADEAKRNNRAGRDQTNEKIPETPQKEPVDNQPVPQETKAGNRQKRSTDTVEQLSLEFYGQVLPTLPVFKNEGELVAYAERLVTQYGPLDNTQPIVLHKGEYAMVVLRSDQKFRVWLEKVMSDGTLVKLKKDDAPLRPGGPGRQVVYATRWKGPGEEYVLMVNDQQVIKVICSGEGQ